ncbi:MAG: 6-phosphogluconolactonase [Salaquimonas sp.]
MQFTAFDDSDALASWLASHVAKQLSSAIEKRGKASLVVSGGSTPGRFFKRLSQQDIGWDKVWITLADERWVAPDSNRSNQRMVTLELLQGKAASAHFIPLYKDGIEAKDVRNIEPDLSAIMPFDVVILGMGADGHTASLFPGGDNLAKATKMDSKALVIDMTAPDTAETRVTLTLAALTSAKDVLLHIEGGEKRTVLEAADEAIDLATRPISFVLANRPDLRVVWAP